MAVSRATGEAQAVYLETAWFWARPGFERELRGLALLLTVEHAPVAREREARVAVPGELTHPDRYPPERFQLANRVTAALLDLLQMASRAA